MTEMKTDEAVMTDVPTEFLAEDAPEEVLKLTPEHLKEFRYRYKCMELAVVHHRMMRESLEAYNNMLRGEYGILGRFSVDSETGEIKRIEEVEDAG